MVSTGHRNEGSFRGPDLRIYVRDVRDGQAKKRSLKVRSWSTVKDIKDRLSNLLHVPPSSQRLYYGPLLTSGQELPNHRTLHDVGIDKSGETILLVVQDASSQGLFSPHVLTASNDVCISSGLLDVCPKPLRHIVQQARRGLALGFKPALVLEGSGGTYFMHDARKNPIAVFKPSDEEPYAVNNPRGYLPAAPGQPRLSLRPGVAPGEACVREVAAFMLDHGGVSSVPMTTLAEARHAAFSVHGERLNCSQGGACMGSHSMLLQASSPLKSSRNQDVGVKGPAKKAGSLQEYVHCECTMDDISPSKLSAYEVQKIALLDIRLMNADRNAANLLVCRRRYSDEYRSETGSDDDQLELVPIDHGYCLRSQADVSWMDWCWLDWPQLKEPICDEFLQYIADLDIEKDARILRERLNICEQAIDIFRASTSLLKAGAAAGLTLYDIACMCCRNDNLGEIPSSLERLSSMASELAMIAVENEKYHHVAASRALVEQLTPKKRQPRASVLTSRDRSSGYRMHKSASSGEFWSSGSSSESVTAAAAAAAASLGLSVDDADDAEESIDRESPGMANSSASDSSSSGASDDAGDALEDQEERKEWAKLMISNVSLDRLDVSLPSRRGHRKGSISSDEGSSDSMLSSSPKGFWHVRPGTSPAGSEESVTWSPRASPETAPDTFSFLPEPPLTSSFSDVGATTTGSLTNESVAVQKEPHVDVITPTERNTILWSSAKMPPSHPSKRPSVTFAPVLPSDGPFLPLATVQVSEFKSNGHAERKNSGMTRSRSHPAFGRSFSFASNASGASSQDDGDILAASERCPQPFTEEYENYRSYFLNFIDLVVERETTAAKHSKTDRGAVMAA